MESFRYLWPLNHHQRLRLITTIKRSRNLRTVPHRTGPNGLRWLHKSELKRCRNTASRPSRPGMTLHHLATHMKRTCFSSVSSVILSHTVGIFGQLTGTDHHRHAHSGRLCIQGARPGRAQRSKSPSSNPEAKRSTQTRPMGLAY